MNRFLVIVITLGNCCTVLWFLNCSPVNRSFDHRFPRAESSRAETGPYIDLGLRVTVLLKCTLWIMKIMKLKFGSCKYVNI
jgi:hypothetical protein